MYSSHCYPFACRGGPDSCLIFDFPTFLAPESTNSKSTRMIVKPALNS